MLRIDKIKVPQTEIVEEQDDKDLTRAWSIIPPEDKSLFNKDRLYLERFLYWNYMEDGIEFGKWLKDRLPKKGQGYPLKMRQHRNQLNKIWL